MFPPLPFNVSVKKVFFENVRTKLVLISMNATREQAVVTIKLGVKIRSGVTTVYVRSVSTETEISVKKASA